MEKVIRLAPLRCLLVFFVVYFSSGPAISADYDATYDGKWRKSDDVVQGWDWSLPPGVRPAPNSGIFNLNSRVPADFPGNHLKQINAKWSELEPVEGQYDFSSIIKALDDPSYEGAMLNVRGMVVAIEDANGKPVFQDGVTAPRWLSKGAPTTAEDLKHGVRITNMHIYDPRVKSRLIKLIQEIGKSPIPGHPKLKAQIIHGVSNSRGEEWTGKQSARPEAVAAMEEILLAWGKAYGKHAKKLAWLKENPERLYRAAVVKSGMGIRGGAIENWLRGQYTPGDASQTGQVLDSNGYLTVDESFPPIAEGRHSQDQNEAYRSDSDKKEYWAQNYRMANLRMLQMRRNIAWTEKNSTINPRMLNWVSLELGQTVESSPDAWVVLMRSWSRSSGDREIKNLERWLHQRDIHGVSTRPALKVEHGWNVAKNDLLPKNLWSMDVARAAPTIGIAVDDRFLSGGPHSVAIKVTYFDSEADQWSLVYNRADGRSGVRTVKGNASSKVKTATFFIDDFAANEKRYDFDFRLESDGKTPFMFVRLIRLDPNTWLGMVPPTPPQGLQVRQ